MVSSAFFFLLIFRQFIYQRECTLIDLSSVCYDDSMMLHNSIITYISSIRFPFKFLFFIDFYAGNAIFRDEWTHGSLKQTVRYAQRIA